MRIFEVKNNLIKIFYETTENLFLSGFVMIKDSHNSYIGQIMHLESSKHGNVAIAKIIFNITEDGVITSYSGAIPAINSALSIINSKDFLKLIQGQNPVIIGEFIENNLLISLDKSLLENKLVICSENQENSDLMIKTLNRQIKNYNKKTVIIDTDGEEFFDKNSFVMSKNFRLPINNQIINYIYEKGLEYKTARSKAIMQETFLELDYYLSSLEDSYIPVNKFIDILEKQYNESKIPELVLLKNALVKFNEGGIFARNIMEYKNLYDSLLNNETTVINVSRVDESIQREVISYVYNLLEEISDNYYVFVKLTNENSDKKLLKQIFSNKTNYTITTCSYKYKYLTELKKIAKDLILFAPILQQQDFASYNTLLSSLGRMEFVVYGQSTQFMPLIVKLSDRTKMMNTASQTRLTSEDVQRIVQKQLKEQQQSQHKLQQQMSQMTYPQLMPMPQPQICYPQQPVYQPPQMFAPNLYTNVQQPYVQSSYIPVQQPYIPMQQPYMNIQQPYFQAPYMAQPVVQSTQQSTVVPQSHQSQSSENVPLQNSNKTLSQLFDSIESKNTIESVTEPANKIFSEDDKPVFRAIEHQEMPIEDSFQSLQNVDVEAEQIQVQKGQQYSNVTNDEQNDENQLTEDDLDLIQNVDIYDNVSDGIIEEVDEQINSHETMQNIEEEPFNSLIEDDSYLDEIRPDEDDFPELEEIEEDEPQDMKTKYNITDESLKEPDEVPVYPADTGFNTNMNFEKGDLVSHKEFGNGRIEKIINYGTKKLCSVYFEGVGRRLLDPSLSEIQKVN